MTNTIVFCIGAMVGALIGFIICALLTVGDDEREDE